MKKPNNVQTSSSSTKLKSFISFDTSYIRESLYQQ